MLEAWPKKVEIQENFLHVSTQLQLAFKQKKFEWEKFATFSNLFFNNKFKAMTEKQSVMDIIVKRRFVNNFSGLGFSIWMKCYWHKSWCISSLKCYCGNFDGAFDVKRNLHATINLNCPMSFRSGKSKIHVAQKLEIILWSAYNFIRRVWASFSPKDKNENSEEKKSKRN